MSRQPRGKVTSGGAFTTNLGLFKRLLRAAATRTCSPTQSWGEASSQCWINTQADSPEAPAQPLSGGKKDEGSNEDELKGPSCLLRPAERYLLFTPAQTQRVLREVTFHVLTATFSKLRSAPTLEKVWFRIFFRKSKLNIIYNLSFSKEI